MPETSRAAEPADLRPRTPRAPAAAARRRLEPATFLLDHVAADLAERLAAVLRRFDLRARSRHARRSGARGAGAARLGRHDRCGRRRAVGSARDAPARSSSPTRRRCRSRRPLRSRRFGAGAAVCQRSAGHARADPPRAQARRSVSGGARSAARR